MPRKVIKGTSDLESQQPELSKEWDYSKNSKTPSEYSQYSNKKAWWTCKSNHSWEAIISNRSKGSGCLECAKLTRGENISKIKNKDNTPLSDNKILMKDFCILNSYNPYIKGSSYQSKVLWICSICSKSWIARINKRIKGNGCPSCWSLNKGGEYVRSIVKSQGSIFETNPEVEEYWNYEKNEYYNIDPSKISAGSHSYAYWHCPKCNNSWKAIIKSLTIRGSRCSKCINKTSKGEKELFSFIKNLHKDAVQNNRIIIKPKELDIYIPSKRLAIEYNGEYWHSNEVISNRMNKTSEDYHKEKLESCKKNNVDLLFVWEDDWIKDKSKVKSALIEYFNNGAKNCILKRLTSNRD